MLQFASLVHAIRLIVRSIWILHGLLLHYHVLFLLFGSAVFVSRLRGIVLQLHSGSWLFPTTFPIKHIDLCTHLRLHRFGSLLFHRWLVGSFHWRLFIFEWHTWLVHCHSFLLGLVPRELRWFTIRILLPLAVKHIPLTRWLRLYRLAWRFLSARVFVWDGYGFPRVWTDRWTRSCLLRLSWLLWPFGLGTHHVAHVVVIYLIHSRGRSIRSRRRLQPSLRTNSHPSWFSGRFYRSSGSDRSLFLRGTLVRHGFLFGSLFFIFRLFGRVFEKVHHLRFDILQDLLHLKFLVLFFPLEHLLDLMRLLSLFVVFFKAHLSEEVDDLVWLIDLLLHDLGSVVLIKAAVARL